MKDNIEIINLADRPQFIEEVSKLIWEQWSKHEGRTLDEALYRTRHSIKKDQVPQTYIAIKGDEMLGTVHIWNNDLKCRQDLTPWMAALLVKPEYRNMGIGTMLQKKCIEVAGGMKYKSIYLITDHDGYYEKSGWNFLERAPLMGAKDGFTKIYEHAC